MLDAQAERRYRADLRWELDRTARLINDLFDYSVIDAGRLQLERVPTNPEVLVSESLEAIRPEAGRMAIALETAFEQGLPLLDADPWRLQRALCNLLVNAVRHTPPQGRIVAAARQAEGAVAFTVADSGAGVAAGQAEQIFEPFFPGRPGAIVGRQRGGTGAGDRARDRGGPRWYPATGGDVGGGLPLPLAGADRDGRLSVRRTSRALPGWRR